jgi:hypothetical protein
MRERAWPSLYYSMSCGIIKKFLQEKAVEATKQEKERKEEKT